MKREKRIKALEARFIKDPIILEFADGSHREICHSDFLLDLFAGAFGVDLSPEQAAEVDLISESVAAREPGGGRLIEVLQALLPPLERPAKS